MYFFYVCFKRLLHCGAMVCNKLFACTLLEGKVLHILCHVKLFLPAPTYHQVFAEQEVRPNHPEAKEINFNSIEELYKFCAHILHMNLSGHLHTPRTRMMVIFSCYAYLLGTFPDKLNFQ